MNREHLRNMVGGVFVALMLALPGLAMAEHDGPSKDPLTPGSVDVEGVIGIGLAICENVTGGAPTVCGSGGFGGAFFNVTHIGSHNTARGDCHVNNTVGGGIGNVSYLCGSDRDDDGFVTNVDNSNATDGHVGTHSSDDDNDTKSHGTSPDYDDQGYSGSVAAGAISSTMVCFAHDTSRSGHGDHDWDSWVIFVGVPVDDPNDTVSNLPNTPNPDPPGVGFVTVSYATGSDDNGCSGGGMG